jgi:hypothetical protein
MERGGLDGGSGSSPAPRQRSPYGLVLGQRLLERIHSRKGGIDSSLPRLRELILQLPPGERESSLKPRTLARALHLAISRGS